VYQKIHRYIDEDEVTPSEPAAPRELDRDGDDTEVEELPRPGRREIQPDDD